MKEIVKTLGFLICVSVLAACGGGVSDDGGGATTTSDISNAVPDDIVISSPTASIAGSHSLSRNGLKGVGDPVANDFASKKEAIQELIAGEGECSFTLAIPTVENPDCYGPTISYENHPDGDPEDGGLPPFDTGLWDDYEGTEACAAAKMNSLVDSVAARVDNIVKMVGSMACAGKKTEATLPDTVGETLNLKDEMEDNLDVTGLTVETATVERLADSGDDPVYQSALNTSMTIGQFTNDADVIVKHIPTADDNSTYHGKISFKMSSSDTVGLNQGENCSGLTYAGTILYEKTSETSVVYEVNYAMFCGSDADPFDDNNNILTTDKYDAVSNLDGWVHDWNYGLFSFNPSTGVGTFAYAWQAGAQDQRTRVLDLTTAAGDNDNVTGTAYYGFGPDVATSGLGTIDGFVCNWAGPNGAIHVPDNNRSAENLKLVGRGWDLAQKQVINRAAGATVFTVTSSDIKYAITNSCNTDVAGFTYEATMATAMDNDRTDNTAVTNTLIPLTEVDFDLPPLPVVAE